MKKTIIILALLGYAHVKSQIIKEESIAFSVGYGLSAPYDDVNVAATGFYLQGEYILTLTKWLDMRPYTGLILTKSNGEDLNENPTPYKATSKAFLIGGKTRITAPIPWVAPYIEVGVGASIGSFRTLTPYTDIDKTGLILHIPCSIGLELGPNHNFDIAFTYYFHPSMRQFSGAAAFGISFPINTIKRI
ncbi:MAG: hypothetical protein RH981_10380 [Arenibacter sp.]